MAIYMHISSKHPQQQPIGCVQSAHRARVDSKRYNAQSDTANTQCTNERGWITTVIVVCTVVPVVVLSITFLYIFKKRALDETTTNLELTERLLDGQRDENELMGQAWSIAEEDLTFGKLIGEGAFGRVWDGTWGHVPVAIKVLRIPFDELDLDMQEDFDREVSTCTHCNVIIQHHPYTRLPDVHFYIILLILFEKLPQVRDGFAELVIFCIHAKYYSCP